MHSAPLKDFDKQRMPNSDAKDTKNMTVEIATSTKLTDVCHLLTSAWQTKLIRNNTNAVFIFFADSLSMLSYERHKIYRVLVLVIRYFVQS